MTAGKLRLPWLGYRPVAGLVVDNPNIADSRCRIRDDWQRSRWYVERLLMTGGVVVTTTSGPSREILLSTTNRRLRLP